eukprot:g46841.t1
MSEKEGEDGTAILDRNQEVLVNRITQRMGILILEDWQRRSHLQTLTAESVIITQEISVHNGAERPRTDRMVPHIHVLICYENRISVFTGEDQDYSRRDEETSVSCQP